MDIKYDSTGDIDISTGDLRLVKADEQHKLTLLLSDKGEIKQRIDAGVGAGDFLLDNDPAGLLREARRQCQRVGMKITRAFFEKGKIKIEGGYDA